MSREILSQYRLSGRGAEHLDNFLQHSICRFVRDLAGSGCIVTAATIPEQNVPYFGVAAPVENRLSDCQDCVLLFQSPQDVYRKPAFRKQGIDHEPVAAIDHLFAPQVEHGHSSMHLGATAD